MTEKTIEGTITFKINIKDGGYALDWDRNTNNELAAAMIARDMVRFNREFLEKLKKNLTGKDLKICRDRIHKIGQTHFGMTLVVQDLVYAVMNPKPEVKEPEVKTEA